MKLLSLTTLLILINMVSAYGRTAYCDPHELTVDTYDDPNCNYRSVPAKQYFAQKWITKLTRFQCHPLMTGGAWAGKCNYDGRSARLEKIEFRFYRDDRCRDKDVRRMNGYQKIEWDVNRCYPHPLRRGYYLSVRPL